MTKLFVLASVALSAFVAAGCSADTTDEAPSTTTTDNGTLPTEQPTPTTTTITHDNPELRAVPGHEFTNIDARARGEQVRLVEPVALPQIEQQVPVLQLKPEPVNQ